MLELPTVDTQTPYFAMKLKKKFINYVSSCFAKDIIVTVYLAQLIKNKIQTKQKQVTFRIFSFNGSTGCIA